VSNIDPETLKRYHEQQSFRRLCRMIAEALSMDQTLTTVDAHHAVDVAVYKLSKQLEKKIERDGKVLDFLNFPLPPKHTS
jgi:hypothetical protein